MSLKTTASGNCTAKLRLASLLCLGFICLAWTSSSLAETAPPEKLLGTDTLALLTSPNWAQARRAFTESPFTQFWNDPAMKPFREKFLTRFREDLLQPLEKEFGVKFSDYAGLARGQITLALTQNEWGKTPGKEPGFLFVLDAGEKSAQLQETLANFKKKWVDSGKQLRPETIREVSFNAFIFSSDDLGKTLDKVFPNPGAGYETLEPTKPKKPGKKLEWLAGQSGSLLVCGNNASDIEKFLARQSGGTLPTLAEDPLFTDPYASQFRESLSYAWVNLKAIVSTADKLAKEKKEGETEKPAAGPSPSQAIAALGLNSLQSLSISVMDRPDGDLFTGALRAQGNPAKGLLKLFAFETKEAAPPAFVPAEVVKYTRWRIDLQNVWNTLESTLTDLAPQMAGVLKLLIDNAGKDKDPNFDLRQNVIANLGDDIISYQKLPRGDKLEDLNSPPSLILIGSPRAEKLAAALSSLSSLLPQKSPRLKEREFLGRTVYTMALPPTTTPDGNQISKNLTYVASGSYVALSTDVAMVEEFLRGDPAKSFRDSPGLVEAAQQVGGMNSGFFGYENDQETMRSVFHILKKEAGTLSDLFKTTPLAGRLGVDEANKTLKDWLDFSLLPPFDRVAKYFYFST
jgi:hypothetical protein